MFCPICGSNLPDDARFCGNCGATVEGLDAQQTAFQEANQPVVYAPQPDVAGAPQGEAKPNRNRLVILLSVIAIAAILITSIIAVLVYQQGLKETATRPIQISLQAEGYTDECTKIPVVATGTNSTGASVETVGFVDGTGYGLELPPGSYELSFPASPLTPDGILYDTPSETETVEISEEQEDEDVVTKAFEEAPAVFKKSTALKETDGMIEAAYEYAMLDEEQADKAEQLKTVAEDTHTKAVEEEEQRKAREAARRIDMPSYTLTIPEYWVGKIEVYKEGNTVYICPKGGSKSNSVMVDATVFSSQDDIFEGDVGSYSIKVERLTSGGYVQLWGTNWPLRAAESPSYLPTDSILDQCIQLETGGKATLADVRRDIPVFNYNNPKVMDYSHMSHDYLIANLTLTPK